GEETGIKFLGLFDKQLIDRRGTGAIASAITELVGRVADDDVELHVFSEQLRDASFDVVGVDEGVGVGFEVVTAGIITFACSAVDALAVDVEGDLLTRQGVDAELALTPAPGVFGALEPDVAVLGREGLGDRVCAIVELCAVYASACQERRDLRDSDAENLYREDVIYPFGKIGKLQDQSVGEAVNDLAEEHTRLGEGVEEGDS